MSNWLEALYLPIIAIGALATGGVAWLAADSSPSFVALTAGLLAGLVAATVIDWGLLGLVLIGEVSAAAGVLTWSALGGYGQTERLVVVVLVVIAVGVMVFAGLVAVTGRADYAVWCLVSSATIAVGWWSAANLSFGSSWPEAGLRAGLYGAVGVLGMSLVISLLEDLRLWQKGRTTGETVTDLLNQLDRIVRELSVLRTMDDPGNASQVRMRLLQPTERAARLVERQLGRSLSRQAARHDSRRILPRGSAHGWLREDHALRGEAIRQWRRGLVLPERDNTERLRSEVIHVMAHVQCWEWLGIPAVQGADPSCHRRRRHVRVLLLSALLFAPLVFLIASPGTPWDVGADLREQLLPFAVPLAFAGVAIASGAVNLRDLSGSVAGGAGPTG